VSGLVILSGFKGWCYEMKLITISVLGVFVLASTTPAMAQPPQVVLDKSQAKSRVSLPETEAELGELLTGSSPHLIVSSLISEGTSAHHRNGGRLAAFLISGADWQAPAVVRLGEFMRRYSSHGWALDMKSPPNARTLQELAAAATGPLPPAGVDEVSLKVDVRAKDAAGLVMNSAEEVKLRREKTAGGSVWRIVPSALDQKNGTPGIVATLVEYYLQPERTLDRLCTTMAASQLRELGLALSMMQQDEGGKYQLDAATFKAKLLPYVKDESTFTAPDDPEGAQSYQFNAGLAGRKFQVIKDPSKTIVIFMGTPGKLDFRYNGRALVTLADGRTMSVDPEEAKSLHWAP
jgi:hypothetical protein